MAGWHHWLDGHEFEWTPGVGDGQRDLACCGSWGCKESDMTERLNWTELNWTIEHNYFNSWKSTLFHPLNWIVSISESLPPQPRTPCWRGQIGPDSIYSQYPEESNKSLVFPECMSCCGHWEHSFVHSFIQLVFIKRANYVSGTVLDAENTAVKIRQKSLMEVLFYFENIYNRWNVFISVLQRR